jgi:hypothetical protein
MWYKLGISRWLGQSDGEKGMVRHKAEVRSQRNIGEKGKDISPQVITQLLCEEQTTSKY